MTSTGTDAIPGVDPGAVAAWLAGAGVPLPGPLRFHPVGNGRSNLTYVLRAADGQTAVLRRPPLGHLLASAHDVGREIAFLRLAGAAGQPVPAVLAHCTDVTVIGAPFYVMDHVAGSVIDSADAGRQLDPAARAAIGPRLARTLARLHTVDHGDATFRAAISTSGADHAARLVHRWRRQWANSKTGDLPVVDEVGDRLAAAFPTQSRTTIVHGDYALHNVIISPAAEVRAVLDWEMATVGDPASDLAWLLMLWPERADQVVAGPYPVPLLGGFADRAALVAAYADEAGCEPAALPYWLALSYWKFAIALAGIYARHLQDPANGGADAVSLGAQVEPVARLAARAADEAGL